MEALECYPSCCTLFSISNVEAPKELHVDLRRTGENSEFGVFMVHHDDPGFAVEHHERKMGLRGSPTANLLLDDCTIPARRVIGDRAWAFQYILRELNGSRALVAAQALGIARGPLHLAVAYVREREQFGARVSSFQMVRSMMMRDAKMTQIYEGGNQTQRLVMSESLYNGEVFV